MGICRSVAESGGLEEVIATYFKFHLDDRNPFILSMTHDVTQPPIGSGNFSQPRVRGKQGASVYPFSFAQLQTLQPNHSLLTCLTHPSSNSHHQKKYLVQPFNTNPPSITLGDFCTHSILAFFSVSVSTCMTGCRCTVRRGQLRRGRGRDAASRLQLVSLLLKVSRALVDCYEMCRLYLSHAKGYSRNLA